MSDEVYQSGCHSKRIIIYLNLIFAFKIKSCNKVDSTCTFCMDLTEGKIIEMEIAGSLLHPFFTSTFNFKYVDSLGYTKSCPLLLLTT